MHQSIGSWLWGHGRLGPYSIVFFDILSPNGTEFVSMYAARDGQIITANCARTSIKVRPSAANSTTIHLDLDLGAEGILNIDLSARVVLDDIPGLLTRAAGIMTGSIQGSGRAFHGVVFYEKVNLN